jgi:outer membrane protein assembly factor BamE (lipoprotein component of BamABCDE complex)
VADVRVGQTEAEVRALLGDPMEVLPDHETETWRYFEVFQPRGCTTEVFGISLSRRPTRRVELVITFAHGHVSAVTPMPERPETNATSAAPQNKRMQLTKRGP